MPTNQHFEDNNSHYILCSNIVHESNIYLKYAHKVRRDTQIIHFNKTSFLRK